MRPLAAIALVVLLAAPAAAQDIAAVNTSPPDEAEETRGPPLVVDQRAERITWLLGKSPTVGAALGGATGAALARAGPGAWREDVVVLQSGPHEDARLVVVVASKQGERTTFDIRAATIVAFVGVTGLSVPKGDLPLRGVFAEGDVRVVVESARGHLLVEAAEAFFDLARERAAATNVEVRGRRPRAPGAGPSPASPTKLSLDPGTFVLRAGRLRALGPDRVVAEEALLAPCDDGDPHVALAADRITATAARGAPQGPTKGPGAPDLTTPAEQLQPGLDAPSPVKRRELPEQGGGGGLLSTLLRPQQGGGGSDALRREAKVPRWVELEGVAVRLVLPAGEAEPRELPLIPFGGWRSDWPVPRVRVGQSSRLGALGIVELRHTLGTWDLGSLGTLRVDGRERVEHYQRRGTGGELGLDWERDPLGSKDGGFREGKLAGFGIDDRAREDRIGTPIETEHRYWLRGLARERLPGGVQLDAEVSKRSDRGVLLEYYRRVAQTEKEQETYLYGRWSHDAIGARAIGRWRLDDFQTQLEQLPEAKLDLIYLPLATDETFGGLYLDLAARAGVLRRRFDEDLLGAHDVRAARGDVDAQLTWARPLGPLQARAWVGARETGWSARREGTEEDEDSIDRFAAQAGWNLSTTLWRTFRAPWGGVLRHDIVPEVGTRHVFSVTRLPSELLAFDEVEQVRPHDRVFLRLRTRLLGDDADGRRRKLADLQVEASYRLTDRRPDDPRRTWTTIAWDLRLDPFQWLTARWRGELDPNRGRLAAFDASLRFSWEDLSAGASYRHVPDFVHAVGWSAEWRLTPAWSVGFEQQYDLRDRQFLAHRARVVRRFHCLAVEVSITHNELQDDTSVTAAVALTPFADDAPFERDRWEELR